jgi:hypothetical protein
MLRRWRGIRATRRSDAVNERGRVALSAGRLDEAERAFRDALALDAENAPAWHNLAIACKWHRQWPAAREAAERALALRPDDVGSAWNLAIAATALGDWALARRGWRAAGVEHLPVGDGPIEMKLGATPIRVSVDDNPEVVWCRRIDPARAIIASVPMASSNRRFGDLLLHDGERVGTRMLGGIEVPVFNELEVLERSRFSTYSVDLEAPAQSDVDALERALEARGLAGEDWTRSVRFLCKDCSEGRPHDHGARVDEGPWKTSRRVGVAAQDEAAARQVLEAWARAAPGRSFGSLELALAATDA